MEPTFDLLEVQGEDPVMVGLFSQEAAVAGWLEVEAAFARSLAVAGLVDSDTASRIGGACSLDRIDVGRLWEDTRNVGYPILPLVKQVCSVLAPEDAAWVHYGATTQDIMDTALALQLRHATDRLLELLNAFGDHLATQVEAHASTPMAARTHAQQAVPTTFGAKLSVFLDQLTRDRGRLSAVREVAAVVSLYGAGGTSAALDGHADTVRRALAQDLDLSDAVTPWHVARDRVAQLLLAVAMLAGNTVRFAREVVDLSRTEVGEAAEMTGPYRGASSTMPQKANPIACEAIIGFGVCAELAATGMLRALEAGHERSAGEWQIEWRIIPEAFRAAASAVSLAAETAESLQVFPDAMLANLALDGGTVMAEAYMIVLAEAVGRDRAHELMYQAVRDARVSGRSLADTISAEAGLGMAILPSPIGYLGRAADICHETVAAWRNGSVTAAGRRIPGR